MKPEKIEEIIAKAKTGDGMVTLATVLNLHDPDQEEMFRHVAQRPNTSGYLKRLIQRDLDGSIIPVYQVGGNVQEPKRDEPEDFDQNLMSSLL